jgi:2-octaprenyl-6-methoxyphenol hydroxylase
MDNRYDVIIVGGGIVGSTLALILAKAAFKVALVEAMSNAALVNQVNSKRTIVLAHSSRVIFESLGCWDVFAPHVCPIEEIHVSDRGQFGTSKISAQQESVPALGYVLPAGRISATLFELMTGVANITIFQPANFVSYENEAAGVKVLIEHNGKKTTLCAELLVAADGQESAVRQFQNIKLHHQSYDQTAIFCDIQLKRSNNKVAYERFTEQGPLAILPLLNHQGAVIWTVRQKQADRLLNLDAKQFLQELQQQFGYRLGRFLSCSEPKGVPLSLTTATQQIQPGTVLLGNAVHTLHPVAGQGLNLALRDCATLSEVLVAARRKGQSLGDIHLLQNYLAKRQADQKKIIALTHSLVGVFSTSLLPVLLARMTGLLLLDRMPWLKKRLTKTALGFSGTVPKLACGISLDAN